jgi:hypothetical protein
MCRACDAFTKIVCAIGKRRQTAIAGNISGRRVDQCHSKPGTSEASGDGGGRIIVGKQHLDSIESAIRSRVETVEERVLREKPSEVGGKPRHSIDRNSECRTDHIFRREMMPQVLDLFVMLQAGQP